MSPDIASELLQRLREAAAFRNRGDVAQAEQALNSLLAEYPDFPPALHELGLLALQLQQFEIAEQLISRALSWAPENPTYRLDLGEALRRAGKHQQAIETFRGLIERSPDFALAHFNLGVALADLQRNDEAIAAYRRALELDPNYFPARANLAVALNRENRVDEAIEACRAGIELQPDDAGAHWNLGLLLLRRGDYPQGWREYEWRWKIDRFSSNRRGFSRPFWDGSDIGNATLLLHTEQGLGDAIQFVRYVPMVASRVKNFILECQPSLMRLFEPLVGAERIVSTESTLPEFEVQAPLLSLPKIFETMLSKIPWSGPYLAADSTLIEKWRARIAEAHWACRLSGKPGNPSPRKIGIVWESNLARPDLRHRAMPPELLNRIAELENVTLFSLQKDPRAKTHPVNVKIVDFTAELNDLADTAALMANLDEIITIDTAVAHLAGAMGKSAFVLLPFSADWRWTMSAETTPWYPAIKLVRQRTPGDWEDVIDRVLDELSNP